MRYANIVTDSYVDGPGRRAVLFTQGCSKSPHCPGCQNQHLWNPNGGTEANPETLAEILVNTGLPITVSGGEPFDQASELFELLRHIRRLAPDVHVILYSGFTFEELIHRADFAVNGSLITADVLVDGPYIQKLDDPLMQYRGSRNQRVIDLRATANQYHWSTYEEGPITLDWDQLELILTDTGDLLAASPIAEEWVKDIGELEATRRCGETENVP
jgi:anaerobic ribonucleoside-triphosphate reductase activating protein